MPQQANAWRVSFGLGTASHEHGDQRELCDQQYAGGMCQVGDSDRESGDDGESVTGPLHQPNQRVDSEGSERHEGAVHFHDRREEHPRRA